MARDKSSSNEGAPGDYQPDPKARRYFKNMTLKMNEYEYLRMVRAAEIVDRRLSDFIRHAVKVKVDDILSED